MRKVSFRFVKVSTLLMCLELETVEPKTEEKTIKEYMEAVISAVKDCVAKANHNHAPSPPLPALRVFYRQDIIGLQTLSKGKSYIYLCHTL